MRRQSLAVVTSVPRTPLPPPAIPEELVRLRHVVQAVLTIGMQTGALNNTEYEALCCKPINVVSGGMTSEDLKVLARIALNAHDLLIKVAGERE